MLLCPFDLIRASHRLSQVRWFRWSFFVTNSGKISHLKQTVIHAIGLSICCLASYELMTLIVTVNGPDWLQLPADRPRLRHPGIVDWRLPEQPASCHGRQLVLFPLVIWTGLPMSPAFNSAVPRAANVLGERQSARGLHFYVSAFLLLFRIVHIAMVVLGGGCSFPSEIRFQWEVVYASQG